MPQNNSNILLKGNVYQTIRKLDLQLGKHLDNLIEFYERERDSCDHSCSLSAPTPVQGFQRACAVQRERVPVYFHQVRVWDTQTL